MGQVLTSMAFSLGVDRSRIMDDVDDEDQYGTAYMTHEDHIDESKNHLC